MPPIASGAKSQNTLMFILWKQYLVHQVKVQEFYLLVFPLTSPMISILGSYGSSGIASLGAETLASCFSRHVSSEVLKTRVSWGRGCDWGAKILRVCAGADKFKIKG
jgi:hypothetical protein